jgi:hypothetical protein
MKRPQWLDDFVRWFFNASPVWVDERKLTNDGPSAPVENRRTVADRRHHEDSHGARQPADTRKDRS